MRDLIVHDTRLFGNTPSGDFDAFDVNETVPLNQFLAAALVTSWRNGGISRLRLLAHGYENAMNQLGYGMQFCKESLTNQNVHLLSLLKGEVNVIQLYSCGVANTQAGLEETGADGDGFTFCRKMAAVTGAWVKASSALQRYNWFNPNPWHWMQIDFGDWEGDVYWFSPDGVTVLNASNKADPT
jgi:hypothetical protein